MTITLPPDLERSLAEVAQRRGQTPEQCAVEILRNRLPFEPETKEGPDDGGTLHDRLAPYIGTWDGPTEPLSEDTGRRFGEIVEEKHARRSGKVKRS